MCQLELGLQYSWISIFLNAKQTVVIANGILDQFSNMIVSFLVPLWMLTFLEDIDAGASYVWSHAKVRCGASHCWSGSHPDWLEAGLWNKGIDSPPPTSCDFWDQWWVSLYQIVSEQEVSGSKLFQCGCVMQEHPRYGASPRVEVAPTLTKGIESPSSTSHGFWDEWWVSLIFC